MDNPAWRTLLSLQISRRNYVKPGKPAALNKDAAKLSADVKKSYLSSTFDRTSHRSGAFHVPQDFETANANMENATNPARGSFPLGSGCDENPRKGIRVDTEFRATYNQNHDVLNRSFRHVYEQKEEERGTFLADADDNIFELPQTCKLEGKGGARIQVTMGQIFRGNAHFLLASTKGVPSIFFAQSDIWDPNGVPAYIGVPEKLSSFLRDILFSYLINMFA